jgi:hypothetical protein
MEHGDRVPSPDPTTLTTESLPRDVTLQPGYPFNIVWPTNSPTL